MVNLWYGPKIRSEGSGCIFEIRKCECVRNWTNEENSFPVGYNMLQKRKWKTIIWEFLFTLSNFTLRRIKSVPNGNVKGVYLFGSEW